MPSRLAPLALTATLLASCDPAWQFVDGDNDGVSAFEGDCWDRVEGPEGSGLTGADIYPGAPDRPYDGVDADCGGEDDYDLDGDGYVPLEAHFNKRTFGVGEQVADGDGDIHLGVGDCFDVPYAEEEDGVTTLDLDDPTTRARLTWFAYGLDDDGNPLANSVLDAEVVAELYTGPEKGWLDQYAAMGAQARIALRDELGVQVPDLEPLQVLQVPEALDPADEDALPIEALRQSLDLVVGPDGEFRIVPPNKVYPGSSDPYEDRYYDGIDSDCDGVDDWDQDADGYRALNRAGVDPGAWALGTLDALPSGGDCVDGDAATDEANPSGAAAADIHPGATEQHYDGTDDDCDYRLYDEDGDVAVDGDGEPVYSGTDDCNADGDLFRGDPTVANPRDNSACGFGETEAIDCNDDDPAVFPTDDEEIYFNGEDDNCDDSDLDGDEDGDGYFHHDYMALVAAGGFSVNPNTVNVPNLDVDFDCWDDPNALPIDVIWTPTAPAPHKDMQPSGSHTIDADEVNSAAEDRPYDGVDQDCQGWLNAAGAPADFDWDGDGQEVEEYAALDPDAVTDSDCVDYPLACTGTGGSAELQAWCDEAMSGQPDPIAGFDPADIYRGATDDWYDGVNANCDDWSDYDADRDGQDIDTLGGTDCFEGTGVGSYASLAPSGANPTHYYYTAVPSDNPYEVTGDGIDHNCDGDEQCYHDDDNDGYLDTSLDEVTSSNYDCDDDYEAWQTAPTTDCDDFDDGDYPGAPEVVDNGDDEDCDGYETCYDDDDDDGYLDTSGDIRLSTTDLDCDDPFEGEATDLTTDCDDTDSGDYPGAPEVVDNGDDEDCDGFDDCYQDDDDDGYRPNATATITSNDLDCDDVAEGESEDPITDCDDTDAGDYPGAPEDIDNGDDEDCDGFETCYHDDDDDGYLDTSGDTRLSTTNLTCTDAYEGGTSTPTTDCDDFDDGDYPGAPEDIDNGDDEDCDGGDLCYHDDDDDGYLDTTGDTVASLDLDCDDAYEGGSATPTTDCDDSDGGDYPGAPEDIDNGDDEDCDGYETCYDDDDDDGYLDTSGDTRLSTTNLTCTDAYEGGNSTPTTDCDDFDAGDYPGATEVVDNGDDEDCDGFDDCYQDDDDDGYRPDATSTITSNDLDCDDAAEGESEDPTTDCDDTDGGDYPGATEVVDNGDDEDCDGYETCYDDDDDDGFLDATGDTRLSTTNLTCTDAYEGGSSTLTTDCDDDDPGRYPGNTEVVADGIDQDCVSGDTCYHDDDDDDFLDTTGDTVVSLDLDCTDAYEGDSSMPTTDCNDGDGSIYPGATEVVADGIDQDCDNGDTCYVDADNDGFRASSGTVDSANLSCSDSGEAGSGASTDCDDDASSCTNDCITDSDSDGAVDCVDACDDDDGDNYGDTNSSAAACLDAGGASCTADAACVATDCLENATTCTTNASCADSDGDSVEDCVDLCLDGDFDNYGTANASASSCVGTACDQDLACTDTDCDDADGSTNPGAAEVTGNGNDDDCDGISVCFEDDDDDGYLDTSGDTVDSTTNETCTDTNEGTNTDPTTDCDDTDATLFGDDEGFDSGTGSIDGIDQDCDGFIDENVISAGDLVITEVMATPAAVADTEGEWFEVYNDSGAAITIDGGWSIQTLANPTTVKTLALTGPITIPAGAHYLFARDATPSSNHGLGGSITADYEYGVGNATDPVLRDSAFDYVELVFDWTGGSGTDGSETVAEMEYCLSACSDVVPTNGAALQLSYISGTGYEDPTDADNWCDATTLIHAGTTDFGTPKSVNDVDCSP